MGSVASIGRNAVNDLKGQMGTEKEDGMYSGVRWGVTIGWLYLIYCVWACLFSAGSKCERGMNFFLIAVFLSQTFILWHFVYLLLIFTKLVQYGIRMYSSAGIKNFMLSIGLEASQVLAGIIWTLLFIHFFEKYKEASWCMRRHTCEVDSLFATWENTVNQMCSSATCFDLWYNLPSWFTTFPLIAYFLNFFVRRIWTNSGLPPPPPSANPPPPPAVIASDAPVPPAPDLPKPADDCDDDSHPTIPPDEPEDDCKENNSNPVFIGSLEEIRSSIREWIEEAIQEIVENKERKHECKPDKAHRSSSRKTKSKSRSRKK